MNWLEIIGTIVGLVYLWLEYRASIWLWIAGLIMPAIYTVVYYQAGLYADFGLNIYYLLASFYGIYQWIGKKSPSSDTTTDILITRTPKSYYTPLLLISLLLTLALGIFLEYATDSNVPWCDAFTTALSIVGMWMLAKKHIEQWWVWGIVDIVSAMLYLYKGLYFTSALYALYAVIVYFGYQKWLKMLDSQQQIN